MHYEALEGLVSLPVVGNLPAQLMGDLVKAEAFLAAEAEGIRSELIKNLFYRCSLHSQGVQGKARRSPGEAH